MVMNGDKLWFKDTVRNKVEEAPAAVQPVIQQFFLAIRTPATGQIKGSEGGIEPRREGNVNDTPAAIRTPQERSDINIFRRQDGLPLERTLKSRTGRRRGKKYISLLRLQRV